MKVQAFALLTILAICTASEGDRAQHFQHCLNPCVETTCPRQPWSWYSLWDCKRECQYRCMHKYSQQRKAAGLPVVKFYGKWPFKRICHLQEACSCLFSLANMAPHVIFAIRPPWPYAHYIHKTLRGYSVMGVNTWFWAAVFHAHDNKWTEAADYFSAILGLSYLIWVVVVRLVGAACDVRRRAARVCTGTALVCHYIYHVRRMLHSFDYGYNMQVGVSMAVINAVGWAWYLWRIRQRPYQKRMALTLLGLNVSIALELFDFPPVFQLFDAHAAWHLVTAPLTWQWYQHMITDTQWDAAHDEAHKKG
jgi:post-GPI attachment to proteins factor 3